MDRFSFLGSAHVAYLDELYQQYVQNPDSIEPSWRTFFQGYDFARSHYGDDLQALVAPVGPEVPEALRKLSELDPSLKFLEGGRYIFFGLAVVLLMMWRPQGVVTRTMLENLRSMWGGQRAQAETSGGGRA